jgi:Tfp pilus assembly protein FimT
MRFFLLQQLSNQRLMCKMCRRSCRGFLLIELVVVIAIFAFITTLAVMHFDWLGSVLVKSEMYALRAACLYAQQRAQTSNSIEHIFLNLHEHSYTINGHTYHLSQGVVFGSVPGVVGPHAVGARRGRASTFSNDTITFYPNGIIQAGMVCMMEPGACVMYALTCGVAHTSYMRMYRYDGVWHLIT